jgi:DNA-nicking Smr family endonuclease
VTDDRDDDARAFAEAMRGARRLRADRPRRVTPQPAPAAAPTARRRRASAPPEAAFVVETNGETVAGRARDVAARTIQELRDGEHLVEATLDLHGRSRDQVPGELERFASGARAAGRRVLLVIHGRGLNSDADGPVLRPAVWDWLASPDGARAGVMVFASAAPRTGGSGATLVLLRRSPRSPARSSRPKR